MHTVLIQPISASESFERFAPLFAEMISGGDVDVCHWVESGHTIDSALPNIRDIISGKTEWRALVLCPNPDDVESEHHTDPQNPFDFVENRNTDAFTIDQSGLHESDIPLIRLSHLLGGLPRFEIEYESVELYEENSPYANPKLGFAAINAEEVEHKNKVIEEWEREQHKGFLQPTEIILLKAKDTQAAKADYASVAASWNPALPCSVPDFAERNSYPTRCRFLAFGFDTRGPARIESSYFRFWVAALLLASNNIQPDYLKASYLYRVDVDFEQAALTESIQNVINKLNFAKNTLVNSIAKEESDSSRGENQIPKIEVGVPVAFDFAPDESMNYSKGEIKLAKAEGADDLRRWESFDDKTQKSIKEMEKRVERTLDFAAAMVREKSKYTELEVKPLSEYQMEDLKSSINEKHGDILEDQANLPSPFMNIKPELDAASEAVKQSIVTRLTTREVFAIIGCVIALAAASAMPAAFGMVSPAAGSIYLGGLLAASVAITFIALWLNRRHLLGEIRKYHSIVQKLASEFPHAAERYSRFLGDVATHMKGSSYLTTVEELESRKDDSFYAKKKHLAYIESFLGNLAIWSESLHVDVDMDSIDAMEDFLVSGRAVDYGELYVFDSGKDFRIPLNDSGVDVDSPYGFVKQLRIEREGVHIDE